MDSGLPETSFWDFEMGYNSVTDVLEFSIQFITTGKSPRLQYCVTNGSETMSLQLDQWKIQELDLPGDDFQYYLGGRIRRSDLPVLVRILTSKSVYVGSRLEQAEEPGNHNAAPVAMRIISESDRFRFLNYICSATMRPTKE